MLNICLILNADRPVIEFLILIAGCNSNTLIRGSTILVHACKMNDLSMVHFLVEDCKCDPTFEYVTSSIESPIIIVCELGYTEIF